jgi:hypothetical protein
MALRFFKSVRMNALCAGERFHQGRREFSMIRDSRAVGHSAGFAFVLAGLLLAPSAGGLRAEVVADEGDAPIPAKVLRYAERLIRQYDANNDAALDQGEWSRMRGAPEVIDGDGDKKIGSRELAQYVANYGRRRKIRLLSAQLDELVAAPPLLQPSTAAASGDAAATAATAKEGTPPGAGAGTVAEGTPKPEPRRDQKFHVSPRSQLPGLPDWFAARDADGDGQLTMAEFAPKATQTDIDEFARYDANGDGLITAKECAGANKAAAPKAADAGRK